VGINGRRPFQEMVEIVQNELVREGATNQESKYKGMINQVYTNELPSLLPEMYIKKEAYVTLVAEYTTGTVTVGTGTSNIKGASTVWTSADTNKLIYIDGTDGVYAVTYDAATSLNFPSSLTWTGSSGSGLTYKLFQNRYSLASDFSYMVSDNPKDPNVVSRYANGSKIFLDPWDNDKFDRNFVGVTGDVYAYTTKWESESPYLYVVSAPSAADIITYNYIPQLTTLTEYTTGTVTFTTGTAVVGAGMAWTTNITTASNAYYIRNDADGTGSDSKWTKILSVANATALTLASVYGYTSGTGITYTISEVSKWPVRFDDAIIYKTALIADPDNINFQKWSGLYQEAINLDKTTQAKRTYSSKLKHFHGSR